jgi:hypothetical protein
MVWCPVIGLIPRLVQGMDDGTLNMILATVQDTNVRIRRIEQAVIEDARERARWNRVQAAIAASLDPELATILDPTANEGPQTDQPPSTDQTPATDPLIDATGASTPRNPFGVPVVNAAKSVSPDTIDPKALDWFVGKDDAYYVHNGDGTDRRATAAETRAIGAQVGSSRHKRRR